MPGHVDMKKAPVRKMVGQLPWTRPGHKHATEAQGLR
jgi:hypothetical protein